MSILTNAQLKALWVTGYKPDQSDFDNLFDTLKSSYPVDIAISDFIINDAVVNFYQAKPHYINFSSSIFDSILLDDLQFLQDFQLIDVTFNTKQNFYFNYAANLQTIGFVNTVGVNAFGFGNLQNLSTLTMRNCSYNGGLITSINHLETCANCLQIDLSENAFTQSAVDNVLVDLVDLGQSSGSVNLIGSSMSAPSSIGLAAKATLVSRGWSVFVHP
jgi:hypothetical protein